MPTAIHTIQAPDAIGPYSQAVRAGHTVFFSGQIALNPETMTMVNGDITQQTRQVFANIQAIATEAGGDLLQIVKLNISLTDLRHFDQVNAVMAEFFHPPYPARACVGVNELPKQALVEIEAIMSLEKE